MKHSKPLLICILALLLPTVSCQSPDPLEAAARVNHETEALIAAHDTSGTPASMYDNLLEIRRKADSAALTAGQLFKKRKYEKYLDALVPAHEHPSYQSAWDAMTRANRSELGKIPAGVWLVNADSVRANTVFMFDRRHEKIIPYNIKGSSSLDLTSEDGLVYSRPLKDPLFFFCNDSSKLYEISMPGNIRARLRKAGTADLAMGRYEGVSGYNLSYDGYEVLEVGDGKVHFGDSEYRVSYGTENFIGTRLKKMIIKDMFPMYLIEKECRKGCLDCWAVFSGFNFQYRWARRTEEPAGNIMYIFGAEEEVWAPSDASESEEWDEVLDEFEDCVEQYVSLAGKAAKGDRPAARAYTELAEEVSELSASLALAEGELSKEQLKRYMLILSKMASVSDAI